MRKKEIECLGRNWTKISLEVSPFQNESQRNLHYHGWSSTSSHNATNSHILYYSPLYYHKNMVIVSLKTLPIKPSSIKPKWREKKSEIYPY